jgi:hypothetical protein
LSFTFTSVGNFVLIGGCGSKTNVLSIIVDVFNVTRNKWKTAVLNLTHSRLVETEVENQYVLFADENKQ